ncbi:MFS transporter [Altererythrobacter lauratis]|uniref:Spinster family MFS transporter n=1 Tax=Alteraurantiacibacter lauratis TaxID=2054627 RepID=A0ABV7EIQ2_9SPHN
MEWRRNSPWFALIVLAMISTVGFIDRIVVNVLVEPIKNEFGLTDRQVSLMGVAFTVLNIGVGLVVARAAERVRRLSLIPIGTVLWSAATGLCGWAGSWVQLLVARMGVGLGEAIGLPSLQSVISDYFPPQKRGTAISVLMLAPALGALIGFMGGGWIAQTYGWRETFLIAAVPGVVLGIVAWLMVAEPRRGAHDAMANSDDVPPVSAVLARLFALPSARQLVIGSAFAAMLGFGLNYFFTSLMIRQFNVGLAEAGLYAGLIASAPSAISVMVQGMLGDRLGAKNPAAYALVPAVCLLLGGPLYALAITRAELGPLLVLVSIATFLNFGYLGITFAALQNLMHPRMRATCSAVLNVVYGVASAAGPFLLGWLSDHLAPTYGAGRGLVLAMAITGALYFWAGVHYLLAARRYGADLASTRSAG